MADPGFLRYGQRWWIEWRRSKRGDGSALESAEIHYEQRNADLTGSFSTTCSKNAISLYFMRVVAGGFESEALSTEMMTLAHWGLAGAQEMTARGEQAPCMGRVARPELHYLSSAWMSSLFLTLTLPTYACATVTCSFDYDTAHLFAYWYPFLQDLIRFEGGASVHCCTHWSSVNTSHSCAPCELLDVKAPRLQSSRNSFFTCHFPVPQIQPQPQSQ
jgi:hypothetical protein